MKNQKSQEHINKIIAFLKKNPDSDNQTIAKGTSIPFIQVWTITDKLRKSEQLNVTNKQYSLASVPASSKVRKAEKPTVDKPEAEEVTAKTVQKKSAKKEIEPTKAEAVIIVKTDVKTQDESEKEKGKNYGRDFSKLMFRGMEYRKSKWCLARLNAHILANPKITWTELKVMLPDNLVRTFGLIRKLADAKKMNTAKQRFFCNRNLTMTLGCGTVIAMTNQISKENLPGIIEAFNKMGVE